MKKDGKAVWVSGIDSLFDEAERYAAMALDYREAADLLSLMVFRDRRTTQERVRTRYLPKLTDEERRIGNVMFLVFERYVADWKKLLEELELPPEPYESSGQFAEDWGAGNRHVL